VIRRGQDARQLTDADLLDSLISYAESRAEDLSEYAEEYGEDEECPGAVEAWSVVEEAKRRFGVGQ
jgi:hypothetical protein